LGIIKSSAEIETLAAQADDNGDVYFVPSFTGMGAPYWDQYARGLMVGLTRGTTRAHIARAALEGIAYQTMDVIGAMKSDTGMEITELRVDGGASANNLLMQFQADMLRVPVIRPKVVETTALGAAYLAGLATGFWKDIDELKQQWQLDMEFDATMDASQSTNLNSKWVDAVERAKGWSK
jgi:glycerol kinase